MIRGVARATLIYPNPLDLSEWIPSVADPQALPPLPRFMSPPPPPPPPLHPLPYLEIIGPSVMPASSPSPTFSLPTSSATRAAQWEGRRGGGFKGRYQQQGRGDEGFNLHPWDSPNILRPRKQGSGHALDCGKSAWM